MIKLLPFILVFFLFSCDEADEFNDFEPENYRLLEEVLFLTSGDSIKTTYEYDSGQLAQIVEMRKTDGKDWVTKGRYDFSYSDVRIDCDFFYYSQDSSYCKNKGYYLIEFGQVKSLLYEALSGDNFEEVEESRFYYNDFKLMRFSSTNIAYHYATSFTEYFYQEEVLSGYVEMVNYTVLDSVVFNYKPNLVEQIYYDVEHQPYTAKLDKKVEYSQDGDRISSILYCNWDETSEEWEKENERYYFYDDNGYLIMEKGDGGEGRIFRYELGESNTLMLSTSPDRLIDFEPDPGVKY